MEKKRKHDTIFIEKIMQYIKSKRFYIGRQSFTQPRRAAGFTLIEFLISIGIVVILSVFAIIILNPRELNKQARDGQRLAELASLDRAIGLYQAEQGTANMGFSQRLYISIPDPTEATDCSGLAGLPPLPTGWSYRCVSEANLRNTNNTGWLPINFNALSSGGAFSVLPVDPLNQYDASNFVNNFFYIYATDGTGEYELNAKMESTKYGLGG